MTIGRIPSVEGGIQPTIVDAKGDLIAATAADTVNRLAVGSNDQVLVADSSASTGLAWKSYGAQFVAGKNKILNSDMSVWQRSTSTTVNADGSYFAPDRFCSYYNAGGATVTWSRQSFTAGTAPVAGYESAFFSRLSATSGSSTTEMGMTQRIEDVRTFAGQTVTFSAWIKTDSARSVKFFLGQYFGSGGSSSVTVLSTNVTTSTSWTRYSATVAVPSISGKTIGTNSFLEAGIWLTVGNASGTPSLDVWGIQLEAGSVATPFTTATGTIQGELAACQRYYWKTYLQGTAPATNTSTAIIHFSGSTDANGNVLSTVFYPVTMRTTPTITAYRIDGTSGSWGYERNGATGNGTLTVDLTGDRQARFYTAAGSNWVVAGHYGHFVASAEL